MNIGILTHYDVNNQGAQLQLYAMYRLLQQMGHNPVVLTYRKNYDFEPEQLLRNQIGLRSVPYILKNFLFSRGVGLTWHNVKKYRRNKRFRLQTFEHSDYVHAPIDLAVVGADEVWSLESGCNMMMYGHGVNTDRVVAYAPSFGQTGLERIDRYHCRRLIASGIAAFSSLAVRDRHTADTVRQLTGQEVPIVCDPALLYRFPLDDYPLPHGVPRKKYLIVYAYDRHMVDAGEIAAIREFAGKRGLVIVSAGTYHGWCDKNIACNAVEWLQVIRHAEMVVTDTFHGTIAAVVTGRPMAVFVRSRINANKLTDLIARLGLQSRRLPSVSRGCLEEVFSAPVDFTAVSDGLERMRKESYAYLSAAIESCRL